MQLNQLIGNHLTLAQSAIDRGNSVAGTVELQKGVRSILLALLCDCTASDATLSMLELQIRVERQGVVLPETLLENNDVILNHNQNKPYGFTDKEYLTLLSKLVTVTLKWADSNHLYGSVVAASMKGGPSVIIDTSLVSAT